MTESLDIDPDSPLMSDEHDGLGEHDDSIVRTFGPVSYTHLTLPTIYSV